MSKQDHLVSLPRTELEELERKAEECDKMKTICELWKYPSVTGGALFGLVIKPGKVSNGLNQYTEIRSSDQVDFIQLFDKDNRPIARYVKVE